MYSGPRAMNDGVDNRYIIGMYSYFEPDRHRVHATVDGANYDV